MDTLYVILTGAVAGFLAGLLMKKGYGVLINIILGVVGGFVGSWLFKVLEIPLNVGSKLLNDIVTAFIGAVVILFVVGLIKKK